MPQPPSLSSRARIVSVSEEAWVFDPGGPLVRTEDAGQHWDTIGATPCPASTTPLAGMAEGRLWLVCGGNRGSGAEFRWVYTSDDAGASWETSLAAPPMSPGYASSFAAVSRDRAFLGGDRMGLYESDDAGHQWRQVIPYHDGGIPAIVFIGGASGWLVQNDANDGVEVSTVWRTTNDGATWDGIPLP